MHSIDAELAGHAQKLDMKLQSLCGNGFSVCCAHACLALLLRSELTNKFGYISLPSILNAINGMPSY